jgi:hypothetical protein
VGPTFFAEKFTVRLEYLRGGTVQQRSCMRLSVRGVDLTIQYGDGGPRKRSPPSRRLAGEDLSEACRSGGASRSRLTAIILAASAAVKRLPGESRAQQE